MCIQYFEEHLLGEVGGIIIGTMIQYVLIVPNWGDMDALYFLIALILLFVAAFTTYKRIMGEPRVSQIVFIVVSILFIMFVQY